MTTHQLAVVDWERLNALVGKEIPVGHMLDPVEKSEIRRYCLTLGDTNPLWLDSNYASKWKGIVAPPTFLRCQPALPPPEVYSGPPGRLWAGVEWEFFKPVRPGDAIDVKVTLEDFKEKQSKSVGPMVLLYYMYTYSDPNGRLYAKDRYTGIVFDGEQSKRRALYGQPGDYPEYYEWHYDPNNLPKFEEPERRGATPRYFEDVHVGQELAPLKKGPFCVQQIVAAHFMDRIRYSPGECTFPWRERPGAIHLHYAPSESWRLRGLPNTFDYAGMREGAVAETACNWMGDDGFLWKLTASWRRPVFSGETITYKGRVVGKRTTDDGRAVVELELWGETATPRGVSPGSETPVIATAAVVLPSRPR